MLRLLADLNAHRARGRAVLSVLGIALGVALGYGVHLVNGAAVSELAASVRELAGEADLEVRGGREGFPESLYPQVARLAGVALVAPRLELGAGIADAERTLQVIGLDVLKESGLHPQRASLAELLEPDSVFLSSDAARFAHAGKLRLVVGQKTVELAVAGLVPMKGVVAVTDIATAQWRLGRLGELNRLEVRLARGANREEVRGRIAALLPPGVFVSTVESLEQASGYPSRAYRVNLNVLAMMALFTGGFLVFSAQALETARRRGEHALLRVLGLRKAEIARLVLLEAAALGSAGALAGVALGFGLAFAAARTIGVDLGTGTFGGVFPRVEFSIPAAIGYFSCGVLVAVLGALLPALDAAHRPAARALKAGDDQAMFVRVAPAWPGLVLLAAGAGLSQLGPVRGLPLFGYAAIAALLLGAIVLMPRFAELAFKLLVLIKTRQTWFLLALSQLRGAPGQSAVSLAAIVASFSLMAAMAVMVASFRQSVDDWLDAVLPAELYLRTEAGDTGYLEPGFEERLKASPLVARADFLRSERVTLDPSRPPVALVARDRVAKSFPALGETYERRAGDPAGVWISEAVSDVFGFSPSEKIILPISGKNFELVIRGVFRDYARQHGAIFIDRADYVALTADRRASDAALWLAPGASVAQAMQAIRALPGGARLEMAEPGDIRRRSLRIFDRSFAITYAMEAVAMLVGLLGLSSSLGAIVLARRREFGMLRHLGVTRGQIAAMLAAEGGLLAALGALAGLAAGGAISLILVHVVNRQSFHWSMGIHPPFAFLFLLTATLISLAIATAVLTGREAMGMDPVRAVREDW
jgi:putative ABC transport system permease protein